MHIISSIQQSYPQNQNFLIQGFEIYGILERELPSNITSTIKYYEKEVPSWRNTSFHVVEILLCQ